FPQSLKAPPPRSEADRPQTPNSAPKGPCAAGVCGHSTEAVKTNQLIRLGRATSNRAAAADAHGVTPPKAPPTALPRHRAAGATHSCVAATRTKTDRPGHVSLVIGSYPQWYSLAVRGAGAAKRPRLPVFFSIRACGSSARCLPIIFLARLHSL